MKDGMIAPARPEDDPRRRWNDLAPAVRDAAYDNIAAVADSRALIDERNAASTSFRRRHRFSELAYGPGNRQRVDIFPGTAQAAPTLIFIHGGYWHRNNKTMFARYGEGVVSHGWSWVLPGHTLAPEAALPDIAREIGTCLDLLLARRNQLGLLGPVILSGWSAGAQLAALHADHPLLSATICISGPFDLCPIVSAPFINASLRLTEDAAAACSPLLRPSPRKPMLICVGEYELATLVADSVDYADKLERDGCDTSLIRVPGANHFTVLDALTQPDGLILQAALRLAGGGCAVF